ncbi:hypothetical protein HY388_01015 [Candidatus Daviesbacteria bacterium]|nr:hypothetical protein [Candidatus Daviesbacteria bacterium]
MPAIAELREQLGARLEQLGKKLQEPENQPKEESPLSLYDDALTLWRLVSPDKKPNSRNSIYIPFCFSERHRNGVGAKNTEQKVFFNLINRVRGDSFTAILSINPDRDADVSFKLGIVALPHPLLPHEIMQPILVIRELPEQTYDRHTHPSNLVILGEGKDFYPDKLRWELVGFDPDTGLIWEGWGKNWPEDPRGDMEWRKKFVREVFELLTRVVQQDEPIVRKMNLELNDAFGIRERQALGWLRLLGEELAQFGSVRNDDFMVRQRRLHQLSSTKLTTSL